MLCLFSFFWNILFHTLLQLPSSSLSLNVSLSDNLWKWLPLTLCQWFSISVSCFLQNVTITNKWVIILIIYLFIPYSLGRHNIMCSSVSLDLRVGPDIVFNQYYIINLITQSLGTFVLFLGSSICFIRKQSCVNKMILVRIKVIPRMVPVPYPTVKSSAIFMLFLFSEPITEMETALTRGHVFLVDWYSHWWSVLTGKSPTHTIHGRDCLPSGCMHSRVSVDLWFPAHGRYLKVCWMKSTYLPSSLFTLWLLLSQQDPEVIVRTVAGERINGHKL